MPQATAETVFDDSKDDGVCMDSADGGNFTGRRKCHFSIIALEISGNDRLISETAKQYMDFLMGR